MATLSVTSKSQTSISVSISGLQYDEDEYGGFRYSIRSSSWYYSSSTSYTFSGLNAGEYYDMYAEALWGTTYYPSGSCSAWTDDPPLPGPNTPTIESYSVGTNSITVRITSNDGSSLETYIYSTPVASSGYPYSLNGNLLTINGLNPATLYPFYLVAYKNGQTATSLTIYIYTLGDPRPSNWLWQGAKQSGFPFNISALEWTNFQNRINAFRTYKNLSTVSFTVPTTGSKFYATQFNEARNAIAAMAATVGTVSIGTPISASLLIGLKDSLNSIT